MRWWRGAQRISTRAKILAWLRSAPRTSLQIAELLNITPQHAQTTLYQLRKAGRIVATSDHPMRYRAL